MKPIRFQSADGKIRVVEVDDDATPQDIEQAISEVDNSLATQISTRGAPLSTRMMVGPETRKPEDRLSTLLNLYPEAGYATMPETGERKLVFQDPRTKQIVYYNPPGFEFGDVAEQARLVSEAAGGAIGGIGTAATGAGAVATPLGAGIGAELGGQAYDLLMQATTPRVETRTSLEQTGAGIENIAATVAGEKVTDFMTPLVKSGAMRMITGPRRPVMAPGAPLVELYRGQGIPTAGAPGAVSGSPVIAGAQRTLENMPSSGRIMGEAAGETFDAVQRRIDEISQLYGAPKTPAQMGEDIASSAVDMRKLFDQRSSQLTQEMSKAIGFDEIADTGNLQALRDDFAAKFNESPATYGHLEDKIKELDAFLEESFERGGMPVRLINEKRQTIGQDLKERGVKGYMTKDQEARRQMYSAAVGDIEAAAEAAGGDAMKALEKQRRYVRMPKTRMPGARIPAEKQIERISQTSGRTAYDQMLKAARTGPGELRKMRKAMDTPTWNDFRATVLEDMGRATPGAQGVEGDSFSVNTFLTNWNKLPEGSRRLLFGDKKNVPNMRDIENLGEIMESLKDAEKLRNFSNTGVYNMWYEILTGTVGLERLLQEDPGGAVMQVGAMLGIPYASAKLLTSDAFVKFLTEPVKEGAGEFNKALSRMISRVVQEENDPQINEDLSRFMVGINQLMVGE